jgi:hypothetical protein
MSTLRPASAKILQHSTGMGAPNAELVRRRAEEIARIDGRAEFHEGDWQQAKRELHGGHELGDAADGADMTSLVSERDMISTDPGHHTERLGMDGDENLGEELIAEGMDEAQHERMLAARLEEAEDDEE